MHSPSCHCPQPAQLRGSCYSQTDLQPPRSCSASPQMLQCPPVVSGMRDRQSWCPSILQAGHSSGLGMRSPADRDRLYGQEHLEEALRQQHLQPSHSHFPEPFELVLSLHCAKRHPGAAGALISIIRPRSVERSEILCYFQLVFQVELIGSWASVPRWRTCGRCLRGEGSSPAHKAAWGTSEGISSWSLRDAFGALQSWAWRLGF